MSKYVEAFEKVKEACASFDTVDELITLKELVDKATPKKPYEDKVTNYYKTYYYCSNCNEAIQHDELYCKHCGQALDLS